MTTTTKQELVDSLRMVMREGARISDTFGADDWKRQVHGEDGGWDCKKVFAHLTATAEITPAFAPNLSTVAEGADAAAGVDINALNAQLVGAKESMSEAELMTAFKTGFENVITFIEGLPDDQLQRQTKFGALEGPVIDILDSVLVLHSMAHIYAAGGSPLG